MNVWEERARAEKVDAVVALLDQGKNERGETDMDVAHLLCELGDVGWRLMEKRAGVKPLSVTSRSAVLRVFENRIRERVPA